MVVLEFGFHYRVNTCNILLNFTFPNVTCNISWMFGSYLVNLSLHHDHGVVVLGERQGNYKQELTIQIEWRQIWYLCFTSQSQIVSEDA